MREKLQLLSRIIFSPPNLRVSGGLPLHHGGSLLHHGGSLLFHRGFFPPFPPHRLGFFIGHQSSFHHQPHLSTVTHLPQIPKTLSPFFTTKPPPTLPHPFPPPTNVWSYQHRSDLTSQLRRSLMGSLFLLLSVTVPIAAPSRPPPEPPPSKRTSGWVDCFLPKLRFFFIAEPPSFRPPPKPNWVMPLPSMIGIVYVAVVCPLLDIVCFMNHTGCPSLFWISVVSMVTFVLVLDPLIFGDNRCGAGTWVYTNSLINPFYRHGANVILASLDHRETTHSRTTHIPAKKMIRNWIDPKTVDSPPLLAIYHMRKMLAWLFGLVVGFVVKSMLSVLHLCIEDDTLYCQIARSNSNFWLGHVPTLTDHLVVMFFFSSND